MNYPINKGSKFFFPFISVVYNMYDDACVFSTCERERERCDDDDDDDDDDDEEEEEEEE